jgi:hypothetical protein
MGELHSETSIHIQYSWVEKGEDFGIHFKMLYFQMENNIHIIINKFKQTGLILDKKKEQNQVAESSLKSKCMKSMLRLHNPLKYS